MEVSPPSRDSFGVILTGVLKSPSERGPPRSDEFYAHECERGQGKPPLRIMARGT